MAPTDDETILLPKQVVDSCYYCIYQCYKDMFPTVNYCKSALYKKLLSSALTSSCTDSPSLSKKQRLQLSFKSPTIKRRNRLEVSKDSPHVRQRANTNPNSLVKPRSKPPTDTEVSDDTNNNYSEDDDVLFIRSTSIRDSFRKKLAVMKKKAGS